MSSHLKDRFPDLLIGSPALNGAMREEPRKKVDEFLPQVKKSGSPLDFLTWHACPLAPGELTNAATVVRETLDAYGFPETESHLNEWNMGPPGNDWKRMRYDKQAKRTYFEDMHSSIGSALTASCLIVLQEAPVDMANYFTAGTARRGFFDFRLG